MNRAASRVTNTGQLAIPESTATVRAYEIAAEYTSPALLHHSVRAYLWAAALARQERIEFDPELLWVAAMFHDVGLVEAFDNHRLAFEEAGGHLAKVFAAGLGWSPQRRTRLHEIIVRHMWPSVESAADPEGHLLERSTGIDISGREIDTLTTELRGEILARWPRLRLAEEFTNCFRDQAARKPHTSAATALANGLATRLITNRLEHHHPHAQKQTTTTRG